MAVSSNITLIGGLFAVISTLVGAGFILGAVVTYTAFPFRPISLPGFPIILPVLNTGYNLMRQFVSEMSAGPSSFLYNTGIIVSGILALPFYPTIIRLLRSTVIAKIGAVTGVISSLGMSMSSVYPLYVHTSEHLLFAMIFFIFTGISIVLLSYEIFRGKFFSKVNVVIGVALAVVDIIFLVTRAPLAEWMITFLVIAWLILAGTTMIIKRNVTEV